MAAAGNGVESRPRAPRNVKVEQVEYRCGPLALTGILALPSSGSATGGVLLVHEASGLGAHVQRRAEQLAELGYAALAADMFGAGPGRLALAAGRATVEPCWRRPGRSSHCCEARWRPCASGPGSPPIGSLSSGTASADPPPWNWPAAARMSRQSCASTAG